MITEYLNQLDGEKSGPIYEMVLKSVERPLFEVVLQHVQGNQTRAAELLGINRSTLRKKMQEYGLK